MLERGKALDSDCLCLCYGSTNTNWVILDMLLNSSVPQFPHLLNEGNNTSHNIGFLGNLNEILYT